MKEPTHIRKLKKKVQELRRKGLAVPKDWLYQIAWDERMSRRKSKKPILLYGYGTIGK